MPREGGVLSLVLGLLFAPPLVWKAQRLGNGYAGAVVHCGIVCTMGERNGKVTVIAVSDTDGKELWATAIPEDDVDAPRSGYSKPQSTPRYSSGTRHPSVPA